MQNETDAATLTPVRPAFCNFDLTVGRVRRLSPHFTRITFTGDELDHFGTEGLDQRIKIVLPLAATGFDTFPSGPDWYGAWRQLPDEQRNPFRTYSIRAIRCDQRELDVDFVSHGDGGPASAWAATARAGDRAVVVGPDARAGESRVGISWNPGAARHLLIAGDETAVPAVSAILAQLPSDAVGRVFLEVPSAADMLEVRAPEGVHVHWLPRAVPDADYGMRLVDAVRGWVREHVREVSATRIELGDIDIDAEILWDVPDPASAPGPEDMYAWIAGEAGAVKTLRRFLVSETGLDRRAVAFMGYWRLGKSEV
ncbi:NADPH-dependent ferric siderophore reductase, contains FAD-binding and SIP domains [Paramicrobacterium humi]|uniref:NADPH-dependent ferric siderophore reductase, contains FAD-binding and SIP domains n=1 Tax=Paramicrobacterium humi TaxID=640635 RepID=A0A1H4P8X3_9MICO|nr:siderophore-interacting protein [Microbacterium humi]SEC03886.1 NADPH-dependent ferric siderophore reductase, contains FAD-binding and SIP domains [Microbacterium humi]